LKKNITVNKRVRDHYKFNKLDRNEMFDDIPLNTYIDNRPKTQQPKHSSRNRIRTQQPKTQFQKQHP
jgi:hypothetical protein